MSIRKLWQSLISHGRTFKLSNMALEICPASTPSLVSHSMDPSGFSDAILSTWNAVSHNLPYTLQNSMQTSDPLNHNKSLPPLLPQPLLPLLVPTESFLMKVVHILFDFHSNLHPSTESLDT